MSKKATSTCYFLVTLFMFVICFNVAEVKVINSYPWSTSQADAQRTGFTLSDAPDGNQTFWKFQTSGPIKSSPAVAEGKVFVGSTDGYLYAVSATDGTKLWEFWAGSAVNSPTVGSGRVFITCSAGVAYALNADTGAQIWNKTLGEKGGSASPLLVGSRVFVGGNQTVYALNEAVGVQLFDEPVHHASQIERLIYIEDLVVAVGTSNTTEIRLTAFEAKDGYGRFGVTLFSSGSDRVTSFLSGETAKIFCVAPASEGNSAVFGLTMMGMIMWEHHVNGITYASPANAYNMVYVPTNRFIYALNMTNGALQWRHPATGASSASSPAVGDGKVYFGLDDGYVYALDALSGNLIWSYKTGGPIKSSPAISDGLLFVGSEDGNLYAIGYPTTQTFNVKTSADLSYEVKIQSSMYVSNFTFNQSLKQFSFYLSNKAEGGFCNISFPAGLLKGPYSVVTDENEALMFEEHTSDSQIFLYFNPPSNSNNVKIFGTEAIAEFPLWASPFAIVIITSLITIGLGAHLKRVNQKRRRNK